MYVYYIHLILFIFHFKRLFIFPTASTFNFLSIIFAAPVFLQHQQHSASIDFFAAI